MKRFEIDCNTLSAQFHGGILQCACDEKETIIGANCGFFTMIGCREADCDALCERGFTALVHDDDRAAAAAARAEALRNGDTFTASYRLTCADGENKWIAESGERQTKDGVPFTVRVLQDVTSAHAANEALQQSIERHKIILDQTTDIIWEWHLADDAVYVSANWQKRFGYPVARERVSDTVAHSEHVHFDDKKRVEDFMRAIRSGAPYSEFELRISDAENNYRWFRVRATLISDRQNRPCRAVGVLFDIDREKRQLEEYRKRASTDALTGLLNRAEFQQKNIGNAVPKQKRSAAHSRYG